MAEETYYLVDFENVGLKGLEGAEQLGAQDHVHLFSTSNAPKINTATLAHFNRTNLMVHEVPVKSQSVDMHLVSFLGFLLGCLDPIPGIVILSNDKDYDNIIQFWKNERDINVTRRDHFKEAAPVAPKQSSVKAKVADKGASKGKAAVSGKEKPAAKETPQAKKSKAAIAEKTAAAKEKPPVKNTASAAKEKALAAVEKAAKAVEPKDKTAVNNAVLKTLSAAKYDNDIVSFCASQVTKLFAEKNGKQQIYRSIISKYGQEKGLDIYRHIKKLL